MRRAGRGRRRGGAGCRPVPACELLGASGAGRRGRSAAPRERASARAGACAAPTPAEPGVPCLEGVPVVCGPVSGLGDGGRWRTRLGPRAPPGGSLGTGSAAVGGRGGDQKVNLPVTAIRFLCPFPSCRERLGLPRPTVNQDPRLPCPHR